MEETFAQIDGAAQHSLSGVNVDITAGGSIVGQGVTASAGAIEVCGGNLDQILRSFGGVEGGDVSFGGKAKSVVNKTSKHSNALSNHLEKELTRVYEHASDLEALAGLAKDAIKQSSVSGEAKQVMEKIIATVDESARSIRGTVDKEVKAPKQKANDFIARNGKFVSAIKSLGANLNESTKAGILSLSFTSVNELQRLAHEVSEALKVTKTLGVGKSEYLSKSMTQLDDEISQKLSHASHNSDKMKEFLSAWTTLMKNYGHRSELKGMIGGGSIADKLVDRLSKSREELKTMVNSFIKSFGVNINGVAKASDELSQHLGKDIAYTDETILFLDTFTRLSEYLSSNQSRIYQHLLELNSEQVDSKEIKERFIASMRDLADRVDALGSQASIKAFSQYCRGAIESVNKFSDMIKNHRDTVKKQGGSTDSMNELFSVDASKIDISGLINPLDNLKIAIRKIQFFRNIAVFRTNLQQTNKELAEYSKDYTKSVGKSIGEAITKISNEYSDIINQISDNKSGMGLEIDMYNESRPKSEKISKEKLKIIYKWQCDARIGLYKTVEAIDLYLLHFTDAVTKNPDAVSDLHKMLSATKIIAKWYDDKAGDNLLRTFESFRDGIKDDDLDDPSFTANYKASPLVFADLENKIGGERANRIYERCRRAVEGVVVLKNIISYFISISEKYGDFKSEKNIYMAPSNIYKNLVNYIWVSALDVNTSGTEILTDNNETKRLLTYEDTKVRMAKVTDIDPEVLGINFNKHSIDKLRILKTHNELLRLKDFTATMGPQDFLRVKQFITSTFARLGKTKYIFQLLPFGVYDLTVMDDSMMREFFEFAYKLTTSSKMKGVATIGVSSNGGTAYTVLDGSDAKSDLAVFNIKKERESDPSLSRVVISVKFASDKKSRTSSFVSLQQFQRLSDDLNTSEFSKINAMLDIILQEDGTKASIGNPSLTRKEDDLLRHAGLLTGFLTGLTSGNTEVARASYAQRTVSTLHYCVMNMLNQYKTEHSTSAFAIDDTYFILTVKAIAGKVMAVTGINSLFKNPKSYNNLITKNQTRLIMGGAQEDTDIIDAAVELYVRLPLLVEFYRTIFDNGNKEYKQESVSGVLDEEQVSYVPEIGNVFSGLIINILDKSKHIDNGVYTTDNMSKIVSEVNSIYKHYKSAVPADQIVRHVMLELVAEVNRRYGVIKRQELLQYYRAVNATKRNQIGVGESNYTNNDLDILNEAIEFEERAPSDEFIKLKSTLADSSTPVETKINKLTDYKILKDFRERIGNAMSIEETKLRSSPTGGFLTMVDRIRLLKKAVASKTSRDEKYDMIIKAIEESESMNQSSNDIFACFHEFVLVPLRTAYKMYHALDLFIINMYAMTSSVVTDPSGFDSLRSSPILESTVKLAGSGVEIPFRDAIAQYARESTDKICFTGTNGLLIGGSSNFAQYYDNLVTDSATVTRGSIPVGSNGNNGLTQIMLMNTIMQFCSNSGDLAKFNITSTNRITIDLSEYQKVCEYLVANVKYMVDKFTGLVPTKLIERVTQTTREGSVYWLEDKMVNRMFNKINKTESERDIVCIENLNKLMPTVSQVIFETEVSPVRLLTHFALHKSSTSSVRIQDAMPVIRDAFMTYDQSARMFILPKDDPTLISSLLFNPAVSSTFTNQPSYGVVQEFNILISRYLNDMYDDQSRKIYGKAFESFAGSALIDALNGQSFPDFAKGSSTAGPTPLGVTSGQYEAPRTQTILSATLAYVMKTLTNRVNPTTGMKIHELQSLQEVSPHVMEKYRSMIPMYLRIFKAFLARCRTYRKMLGRVTTSSADFPPGLFKSIESDGGADVAVVKENALETTGMRFSLPIKSIQGATGVEVRDTITLYLDEIVNGMSALVKDAQAVQSELLETDSTVSLYFDVKKDFTKNYFTTSKELPFAPLSVLAMGLKTDGAIPLYNRTDSIDNKFLYGLRSLLMDDFKLSSNKVPYLKKLLNDFNGYATKSNNISDDKFNDVLKYVGTAINYLYDLRFFNGKAISHCDILSQNYPEVGEIHTYQESVTKANSMTLVESVNVVDSRNKIADYIKVKAVGSLVDTKADGPNPRARVVMVNIIDMSIMPINVHSLMREIPLANLYNYAMTFDSTIASLNIRDGFKKVLQSPYSDFVLKGNDLQIGNTTPFTLDSLFEDISLRFISDVLIEKVLKHTSPSISRSVKGAGVSGGDSCSVFKSRRNSTVQIVVKLQEFISRLHPIKDLPMISKQYNDLLSILYDVLALGKTFYRKNNLMPVECDYNIRIMDDIAKQYKEAQNIMEEIRLMFSPPNPARMAAPMPTGFSFPTSSEISSMPVDTTSDKILDEAMDEFEKSLRSATPPTYTFVEKNSAKHTYADGVRPPPASSMPVAVATPRKQRIDSKLYHNLFFLTLVQYAIKQKVKSEVEFINTRIVTNTNAVSNVVTDATPDTTDDLFEF